MKRFYTYPPTKQYYPHILRRIDQKPRNCRHEIVDVGILDIIRPPYKHGSEKLELWESYGGKGALVVPDMFQVDESGIDNVKCSQKLLKRYYDVDDDVDLMPVIQGYTGDWYSIINYCIWFLNRYEQPKWLGIGARLGKYGNNVFVNKTLRDIRQLFPDSWIHVFALNIPNLRYGDTKDLIDSYDSTTWTYPQESGRGSARSVEEKAKWFDEYIERLGVLLDDRNIGK